MEKPSTPQPLKPPATIPLNASIPAFPTRTLIFESNEGKAWVDVEIKQRQAFPVGYEGSIRVSSGTEGESIR
jgi:hypothetical protein